jgi:hypothetical protein
MQIQTKGADLCIQSKLRQKPHAEQCDGNEDQKCVLFLDFECQRNNNTLGFTVRPSSDERF